MKLAVATDSNSCISQKEAEELGIFVLPMPFTIDGEEYFEDINLTQEEFYEKLAQDADISTSQPAPADLMDFWRDILKEYDELVYIPMTSGLSGSCQTARALAMEDDFEGRVFVIDNRAISFIMRHSAMDALELSKRGYSGQEVQEILERNSENNSIYIELDTLKYLKKGGRITKVAAAIGTMLKIKPVLTIVNGGKLDAFSKARTIKQGKEIMINAVKQDLTEKFHDLDASDCYIDVAHTENLLQAEKFSTELSEIFPNRYNEEILINPLSLSISCHVGPGTLAVAVYHRIEELKD